MVDSHPAFRETPEAMEPILIFNDFLTMGYGVRKGYLTTFSLTGYIYEPASSQLHDCLVKIVLLRGSLLALHRLEVADVDAV